MAISEPHSSATVAALSRVRRNRHQFRSKLNHVKPPIRLGYFRNLYVESDNLIASAERFEVSVNRHRRVQKFNLGAKIGPNYVRIAFIVLPPSFCLPKVMQHKQFSGIPNP